MTNGPGRPGGFVGGGAWGVRDSMGITFPRQGVGTSRERSVGRILGLGSEKENDGLAGKLAGPPQTQNYQKTTGP